MILEYTFKQNTFDWNSPACDIMYVLIEFNDEICQNKLWWWQNKQEIFSYQYNWKSDENAISQILVGFYFQLIKNKFGGFVKQENKLVWPFSATKMPKLYFFGINLDSQFFYFFVRIQKGFLSYMNPCAQ